MEALLALLTPETISMIVTAIVTALIAKIAPDWITKQPELLKKKQNPE